MTASLLWGAQNICRLAHPGAGMAGSCFVYMYICMGASAASPHDLIRSDSVQSVLASWLVFTHVQNVIRTVDYNFTGLCLDLKSSV